MNKITISAADHSTFEARLWPQTSPVATIHLMHGMAEHCDRYIPLAEFLHQAGYQVVTHNHRGHGERRPRGHYADANAANMGGWELLMDDILRVQQATCGDEPRILLGHSMGSFIAQGFAIRHGDLLSGLILSGSNHQSSALFHLGRSVASLLKLRQGQQHLSGVMDALSFGAFNKAFRPNRTDFDWLSRDHQQVDRYLADAACGHLCSLQLWTDLFSGLIEIGKANNLRKIPAHLPIYLFGGDRDPVGQMGKGVPALKAFLEKTGHDNVTLRMYPEGRHEMLNETNASEVFQDTLNWLKSLSL